MQENTRQVLDWIGLSEGGYVNHPSDPGGATDRGITQRTYDAWNRMQGQPLRPVKGIPKGTAEAIIVSQYFRPVRFDDLPGGLDYAVADYAVNSGPAQAAKALQRLLGVTADGIIGAQTLAQVRAVEAAYRVPDLIARYCTARMDFLMGLSTWRTFGRGWARRVMGERTGVQADDIGVIDRAARLARGDTQIPAPRAAVPGRAAPEAPRSVWAALWAWLLNLLKGGVA